MKPTIIEPVKTADHYEWTGLEVRRSNEANAGSGVFARTNLRAGLMVPIIGIIITADEDAALVKNLRESYTDLSSAFARVFI